MSALGPFRSSRLKLRHIEHTKDRCGPFAEASVDGSPGNALRAPMLYQRKRIAGQRRALAGRRKGFDVLRTRTYIELKVGRDLPANFSPTLRGLGRSTFLSSRTGLSLEYLVLCSIMNAHRPG